MLSLSKDEEIEGFLGHALPTIKRYNAESIRLQRAFSWSLNFLPSLPCLR